MAYLSGLPARILLAIAALVAVYFVGDHNGANRVKNRTAAERAIANDKAVTKDAAAKEAAAFERVTDTSAIATTKAEQVQSYANESDPAVIRLRAACQRLRVQRGEGAALPAACGPGR